MWINSSFQYTSNPIVETVIVISRGIASSAIDIIGDRLTIFSSIGHHALLRKLFITIDRSSSLGLKWNKILPNESFQLILPDLLVVLIFQLPNKRLDLLPKDLGRG